MRKDVLNIAGRKIGKECPCFLIAESGTTANGDLAKAFKLIDMAQGAGFDAVKFQTIGPESNISDRNTVYEYRDLRGEVIRENMYEMFRGLTFTPDEWMKIAEYSRKKEILFFSTVDYLDGVDVLERCGVPIHKMGSWDVTYEPLIIKAAKTGKPLMLDLGPATLCDIVRLMELHQDHGTGEVILLHDFHTEDFKEMNMRTIPYLQQVFGLPVGFSAPGRDIDLDIMALALGADVIEKRITTSRSNPGHHHAISLEGDELPEWVGRMRKVEECLGILDVRPSSADLRDAQKYFRSICTTRELKEGEQYLPGNLDAKRPGTGIPSRYLEWFYLGRAKRNLAANELLKRKDLLE